MEVRSSFLMRIFIAVFVGVFLILGAYWLKINQPPKPMSGTVEMRPNTFSRSFINVTDKNGDGLPDWQEALAVGEVMNLDEISTTTPYEPSSETGRALYLLTQKYIMAKNSSDTPVSAETIVNDVNQYINSRLLNDEIITLERINIYSNNSELAVRKYGNAVAELMYAYPVPENIRDEMTILNDALLKNNPEILGELKTIIAAYETMLEGMLTIPVPSDFATEHLALTNVYQSLIVDLGAFSGVFDDALPTLVRLRRYPEDADRLYTSIINLYQKMHVRGIKWSNEDVAAKLITVTE